MKNFSMLSTRILNGPECWSSANILTTPVVQHGKDQVYGCRLLYCVFDF